MTRSVRDRVLQDANGYISDHLSSHIHLTNCIHLKNHMHKQSPMLTDRSLIRDLVALLRSRSLRDPSMSPPAWQSPSPVAALLRGGERDSGIDNGRRSIRVDCPRDVRGVLGSSPTARLGDITRHNDRAATVISEHNNKSGVWERRRAKREVLSGGNFGTNFIVGEDKLRGTENGVLGENITGNSQGRDTSSHQRGNIRLDDQPKTLSQQLRELPVDSDDAAFSHNHVHGTHCQGYGLAEEAKATTRGQCSNLNRGRRRKFRAARRTRASAVARDAAVANEMSMASNSISNGAADQICHHMEGDEHYTNQNVSSGPRNGCGIPFNWSRIHHRGKSFLDSAGRSLSCGLSDPRLSRGGLLPRGKDTSDVPAISDYSGSSGKSDAEALPLLLDASVSQGSTENAAWIHDYSGELGFYADNLLKHEIDSDLISEARSGEQHKFRGRRHGRHQSVTQKYMPRTFRDLVGQHLVAQALSNAAAKRKVGLLYVFYGPHGTGKTSTARIFARALNCQSLEHPKPCGVCNSCVTHDMGKSQNIREIGPVTNFDFESIMDLLDNMIVTQLPSNHRVFIFDDCDTLSPDCWCAIVKVIDRAPRRVAFVLVCSSLDVLPHIIISRCQKFFFPKLKDADIIYSLQWIATNEDLEIDKDAVKLIASKSDGSLRDAEMTLEQLSLLGQRISVPLVQEMVGLISDEKLIDLLDLALSADTVHTVKNLREIMESGVEPLALMSQLATVITDILAGDYHFIKEGHRRKFFRRQALLREDMEKLRQALKTLSDAEKQLRMSNDRLTWLTAALLQLAPDQNFMFPSSSTDTSFNHSPLGLNSAGGKQKPRKSNVEHSERPKGESGISEKVRRDSQAGTSGDAYYEARMNDIHIDRSHQNNSSFSDRNRVSGSLLPGKYLGETEEIWLEVLEQIRINGIKEFLYREGKLISVNCGAAPTVLLVFTSNLSISTAERFKSHILQAFKSVLGPAVKLEIQCEPRQQQVVREGPLNLSSSHNGTSPTIGNGRAVTVSSYENRGRRARVNHSEIGRSEIVELEASPSAKNRHEAIEDNNAHSNKQNRGSSLVRGAASAQNHSSMVSFTDQNQWSVRNQNLSLVKGKVSLAHVIQQVEGYSQQGGWSKRKAVSIAEKLEQENLRLEPRSRSLLCWKVSKVSRRKWKMRTRKSQRLPKFMTCGNCIW